MKPIKTSKNEHLLDAEEGQANYQLVRLLFVVLVISLVLGVGSLILVVILAAF